MMKLLLVAIPLVITVWLSRAPLHTKEHGFLCLVLIGSVWLTLSFELDPAYGDPWRWFLDPSTTTTQIPAKYFATMLAILSCATLCHVVQSWGRKIWFKRSPELRRHPRFKDLLVTVGTPLRKKDDYCVVCADKIKTDASSLTHVGCEFSIHKGFLEEWQLRSKQLKCPCCQQRFIERIQSLEEQKFSRIIDHLRKYEKKMLRTFQGHTSSTSHILPRQTKLQEIISFLEERETRGFGSDKKAIAVAEKSIECCPPESREDFLAGFMLGHCAAVGEGLAACQTLHGAH